MYSGEVQPYLDKYYASIGNSKIKELIEYATDGGKCIRGFIVKHILETLTGKQGDEIPWQPIVSVELVHSTSIVIDDLPCMDNDTYRRGKLSTFKQFGNNEAILSSYYMVSETLRILIDGMDDDGITSLKTLKHFIKEWCDLLGKQLVVGQFLDLKCDAEAYFNIKFSSNNTVNDSIIRYKTCSLFSFSFLLGAIFSGKSDPEVLKDFKDMGYHFGVMFQIMDDYRDKDTDVPYANYVLSNGLPKAVETYKESRGTLCLLLQKYQLYTDKFIGLIANIDKMFV